MSTTASVFISYAWGGESEEIVNELDQALLARGLQIVRDKRDLGFKGLIREFMQQIGQGRFVIVVLSDKYLKSPNCMFELLEIAKHGNFAERIFPIVLPDARFYDPIDRIGYLKHWEERITLLNEQLRTLGSYADTQGLRDDIDLYTRIRAAIAQLTDTLRNMNTLTAEMHRQQQFAELFNAIEKQHAASQPNTPITPGEQKPSAKRGKVLYHIPSRMSVREWHRCLVRLAVEEFLLTEDLEDLPEQPKIESVRIGKVMEVELREPAPFDNFEIVTDTSKEQIIFEDDYTEWIFRVKPKSESGQKPYTLVLKITLIQLVEGYGERRKDIVLERAVHTFVEEADTGGMQEVMVERPQLLEASDAAMFLAAEPDISRSQSRFDEAEEFFRPEPAAQMPPPTHPAIEPKPRASPPKPRQRNRADSIGSHDTYREAKSVYSWKMFSAAASVVLLLGVGLWFVGSGVMRTYQQSNELSEPINMDPLSPVFPEDSLSDEEKKPVKPDTLQLLLPVP